MIVRWLVAAVVGGVLFVGGRTRTASANEDGPASRDTRRVLLESSAPLIDEIVFVGLRHIAPEAVAAQISSHAGLRFDLKLIESDVRALGRLGWFSEIGVETELAQSPLLSDN